MAGKDKKGEAEAPEEEKSSGGLKKIIIFAVLGLVLMGGGAGGAYYFFVMNAPQSAQADAGEAAEAVVPKGDPTYVDFDPAFTVAMEGSARAKYLQISVSALTYYEESYQLLKDHAPLLRSELILLFNSKEPSQLETPEGKEALRQEVKDKIETVLIDMDEEVNIDSIYFTKFIMQ